jgi:hypothetical protein
MCNVRSSMCEQHLLYLHLDYKHEEVVTNILFL